MHVHFAIRHTLHMTHFVTLSHAILHALDFLISYRSVSHTRTRPSIGNHSNVRADVFTSKDLIKQTVPRQQIVQIRDTWRISDRF